MLRPPLHDHPSRSERRFFMRPDRETNNAFIYCHAL
jgi:hypothetical protein